MNNFSPQVSDYDNRFSSALQRARNLSEDELLRLPTEAIVEALTDEYSAAPIEIYFDRLSWNLEYLSGGYPAIIVSIPASGCTQALMQQPLTVQLTMYSNSGDPVVTLKFPIVVTDPQLTEMPPGALKQAMDGACDRLQVLVATANREIAVHRQRMREAIQGVVEPLARRLRAFRQVASALGIPVTSQAQGARIQLQPRRITLSQLGQAVSKGTEGWHLEEQIAEDIITTITSFNTALERLVATASKLAEEDEETIRDLLLFILNANYQGIATGETFIGHGKADILLRWRDRDAFVAELKFWRGGGHFTSAFEQLLDRYTIWRDTRVALVMLIRDIKDISMIIERARRCIANHGRTIQVLTTEEPDKRCDYLVRAVNDEQRIIKLTLLPVVIPRWSPPPA